MMRQITRGEIQTARKSGKYSDLLIIKEKHIKTRFSITHADREPNQGGRRSGRTAVKVHVENGIFPNPQPKTKENFNMLRFSIKPSAAGGSPAPPPRGKECGALTQGRPRGTLSTPLPPRGALRTPAARLFRIGKGCSGL